MEKDGAEGEGQGHARTKQEKVDMDSDMMFNLARLYVYSLPVQVYFLYRLLKFRRGPRESKKYG